MSNAPPARPPDGTSKARADELYRRIEGLAEKPTALMEVCGTHTMAISRFGLRARLPETLRLLSGPGCPVCVTPVSVIDHAIELAREPGVTLATFGDMLRVPGSASSLDGERARGADVRVVYSPVDALAMAEAEPSRLMVFIGVGFETTSPTIAAAVERAAKRGVRNFLVLPAFKLVPPAMEALLAAGDARIDGFICPGHVSAIIGTRPYEPVAAKHGVPCVIVGFEALDILEGIVMLLEQRAEGRPRVAVQYRRAIRPEGNPAALRLLHKVFRVADASWRGIGVIPSTGLEMAAEYAAFDVRGRVEVEVPEGHDLPPGCSCGEVMRGLMVPTECALFGEACTPADPVGPCMVSSEGACAAYYRYR